MGWVTQLKINKTLQNKSNFESSHVRIIHKHRTTDRGQKSSLGWRPSKLIKNLYSCGGHKKYATINCKKPGRSIFSSILFLLCKLPSCTCGIKIRSFECILVATKASEGIKVAARNLLTFIRWYIIICNALFSFLIHAFTHYCCISCISGPNMFK